MAELTTTDTTLDPCCAPQQQVVHWAPSAA